MGRIAIALWLAARVAAGFEPSTIAAAKLNAADGGSPCVLDGAVTMQVDGGSFYLQDDTSGVRVSAAPYVLKLGELLEVEGWIYLTDSGEFQVQARKVWNVSEGAPPRPRLVTLDAALGGAHEGQLIGVRGTVLNVDFGKVYDTISIQSDRHSLRVFFAANPRGLSVFEKIYPGTEVAVSGISVPQTVDPEYDGYQLRLRSADDLEIRPGPRSRDAPLVEWGTGLAAIVIAAAGMAMWTLYSRRRWAGRHRVMRGGDPAVASGTSVPSG